jgi:hypothetical protein
MDGVYESEDEIHTTKAHLASRESRFRRNKEGVIHSPSLAFDLFRDPRRVGNYYWVGKVIFRKVD